MNATKRMNTRRSAEIRDMTAELATVDPNSIRARDLRHTIRMNEQYMEEPYTDAYTENSLGNVEAGLKS